jgi:hypothetical protein
MRAWLALVVLSVAACGSPSVPEERPASAAPAPVAESVEQPEAPEEAPESDASCWATIEGLRLGMRPGLGEDERPTSPEEAVRALRACGPFECGELVWESDEEGVLDGTCEGVLPIEEGLEARVRLTFRRFEIPGESGEPGLLTVELYPPRRQPLPDTAWQDRVVGALERRYGAPEQSGMQGVALSRWRTPPRFVALVRPILDPSRGRPEELCTERHPCPEPRVWIGGPEHPALATYGFVLSGP